MKATVYSLTTVFRTETLDNLKQFREDYVITEAEKNACEEYTSDNDFNIYINDDYIEQTNEIKEFQLDLK